VLSVLYFAGRAARFVVPIFSIRSSDMPNQRFSSTFIVSGKILLALLLLATVAWAGTEKVLYRFAGGRDGSEPAGILIFDKAGNLYGVTDAGGNAACTCGTVFKLAPTSSGFWKHTVLHTFVGGKDGFSPTAGLVTDAAGNLYGTTIFGGGTGCGGIGCGTVFELSPAGGWTETVLYRFTDGDDGSEPAGGVVLDGKGNLYGTAAQGGVSGNGTVFELTPGSGGGWVEITLHSFGAPHDGGAPAAPLTITASGTLYGVAQAGGAYGAGSVFRLVPNSSGGWTENVLHDFTGSGVDGAEPTGPLVFKDGNLYGIAADSGTYNAGLVFELTPAHGNWPLQVIYAFTGGNDGGNPSGGIKFDNDGNMYGTTEVGGFYQWGTVFELVPQVGGGWQETVLYDFKGQNDGGSPSYGVVNRGGTGALYGMSDLNVGFGSIFRVTP
jgi:uncharacterized repeat protein (TIGR03803 family)